MGRIFYVELTNKLHDLSKRGDNGREYLRRVHFGVGRAPIELIAHVASEELDYRKILTADYVMANPMAAEAYGAPMDVYDDLEDPYEFRPSRISAYYRDCEGKEIVETDFGTYVKAPGPCPTDYPHAGVLNAHAFLNRYPTTATNRNRARSRWTYYHFLGLDIEKSESRTMDPEVLKDTNNPTMHNPACTACHERMDPVAGAFQNYGNEGYYRDQPGGMDSLDGFYKNRSGGGEDVTVDAGSWEDRQTFSADGVLIGGQNKVGLQVILPPDTDFSGWTPHLGIDHITIRKPNGALVERLELEEVFPDRVEWPFNDEYCGQLWSSDGARLDSYRLWECPLTIPVEVPETGQYIVETVAWILDDDDRGENPNATMRMWVPAYLYEQGDTWYRDMRKPGFVNSDGDAHQVSDDYAANSVQWLTERIVEDHRFAEAAVKFWWPAILGSEFVEPPEDDADADFESRRLASTAQRAEMERLARGFRQGFDGRAAYDLKDLLVEIVLSEWFRAAARSDQDPVRAAALRGAGARRLLTPEELAAKTRAIAGFEWGKHGVVSGWLPHEQGLGALAREDEYRLLYGGIDSDGVTDRARELSPTMFAVAQSHAAETACPVILREFYLLPDDRRKLFGGIDSMVSPVSEFGGTFEISAASREEIETLSLEGSLPSGTVTVTLAHLNEFFGGEGHGHRGILLDRLVVRRGEETVYEYEIEELDHPVDCHHIEDGAFHLSSDRAECILAIPVDLPADGTYRVDILAWADRAGDELASLAIAVESDAERSAGAAAIRMKLAELYSTLLGVRIATDSTEVQGAYGLFVDVWRRKSDLLGNGGFLRLGEDLACEWQSDRLYFQDIAGHLWRDELDEHGDALGWDGEAVDDYFDQVDLSDSRAVARTWTVVFAYLLMDYRYLHL